MMCGAIAFWLFDVIHYSIFKLTNQSKNPFHFCEMYLQLMSAKYSGILGGLIWFGVLRPYVVCDELYTRILNRIQLSIVRTELAVYSLKDTKTCLDCTRYVRYFRNIFINHECKFLDCGNTTVRYFNYYNLMFSHGYHFITGFKFIRNRVRTIWMKNRSFSSKPH